MSEEHDQLLALAERDETHLVRAEVGALEAMTRSEVSVQLDAAHRYPRSIAKFLKDAKSLATLTPSIAESCMYSVPRGGKMLTGKSVRLAEIVASTWGNLHVGARVVDIGEREVTAQAVVWDMEKNVRVTVEAQRSIWGKRGRFDDDMIRVTGMAAISIALRNAVFRVVPGAYADSIYDSAREVAVGDAKTLVERRDSALAKLAKSGATQERILARLGVRGVDDIALEHLEVLFGLHTAIKGGDVSVDEAFPAPTATPVPAGTPEGRRISLKKKQPTASGASVASEGAAATEASGNPPRQPAAKASAAPEDIVNPTKLVQMLREACPEWDDPDVDAISTIEAWTEAERRSALDWVACVLSDGDFKKQQARPAHTIITSRQPGDD